MEVDDESHYWDRRDPKDLVDTVGEWNQFVAAFAGTIQDLAGRDGATVKAPITRFPDFEHLEARGLSRLRRPIPATDRPPTVHSSSVGRVHRPRLNNAFPRL